VTSEQREQILQAGFTVDDFLRFVYRLCCYAFAASTLIYQSAMAIYYRRRRPAVAAALKEQEAE
jgi:hypothetical protein